VRRKTIVGRPPWPALQRRNGRDRRGDSSLNHPCSLLTPQKHSCHQGQSSPEAFGTPQRHAVLDWIGYLGVLALGIIMFHQVGATCDREGIGSVLGRFFSPRPAFERSCLFQRFCEMPSRGLTSGNRHLTPKYLGEHLFASMELEAAYLRHFFVFAFARIFGYPLGGQDHHAPRSFAPGDTNVFVGPY
jgi:hypothetical protein